MAFALSLIKIEEALKQEGCPACRLEHNAARMSIDSFLWENVNDPQMRGTINDALGFCPEHTRMLVAAELFNSGHVLGVNLIYELLAKIAAEDLKHYPTPGKARSISGLAARVRRRIPHSTHLLQAKTRCPACLTAEKYGLNSLGDLFETLQDEQRADFRALYQASGGLCLNHLRRGIAHYEEQYPAAVRYLVQNTVERLENQRGEMLAYIDKQDWNQRDEKLSHAEATAWLKTLAFFTGLPQDRFSFRSEDF